MCLRQTSPDKNYRPTREKLLIKKRINNYFLKNYKIFLWNNLHYNQTCFPSVYIIQFPTLTPVYNNLNTSHPVTN